MVRAVLAPKSIEKQFINRVSEGNDNGLVQIVLTHRRHSSTVRVCLCEDGRLGFRSCAPSVKDGIRALFSLWGVHLRVEVLNWSFMGVTTEMTQRLMSANIFYFAGLHQVPQGLNDAMRNGPLLHLLRERIQYNQCAFFGVCGGAKMAGKNNEYGLPGLDIFDGITVLYDANVRAREVQLATNAEAKIIQLTTGCALAFIMDATYSMGTSFTCLKNHAGWEDFAEQNTQEVQRIIALKMDEWKPYYDEDGTWYFNLRGYMWILGEMWYCSRGSPYLSRVPLHRMY